MKTSKNGFTRQTFLNINISGLPFFDKDVLNNQENKNTRGKKLGGFTLVEMIVSIGLFTIVLFIATSAFLTIVNADRKSRAVRIATDNLNLALEDMQRRIKTGTEYYCGTAISGVNDCSSPATSFSFTGQDGKRVTYTRNTVEQSIYREIAGEPILRITSPEVSITNLSFFVKGSAVWPNLTQPAVLIAIKGSLGAVSANQASKTDFNIQTVVAQRAYDH